MSILRLSDAINKALICVLACTVSVSPSLIERSPSAGFRSQYNTVALCGRLVVDVKCADLYTLIAGRVGDGAICRDL